MPREKRERYRDGSIVISKWWIPFITLNVIWVCLYFLFEPVRFWTIALFTIVFTNVDLIFIFISLLIITAGWTVIELFAAISWFLFIRYKEKGYLVARAIRFSLITFLLATIFMNFFSIFSFHDFWLYMASLGITALLCYIYFKSDYFKRAQSTRHKVTYSHDLKFMYIPIEKILMLSFFLGFAITVTVLYYQGGAFGVTWVKYCIDSIIAGMFVNNYFLLVLVILVASFTVFYPGVQILGNLLPYYSKVALQDKTKERIKELRIWTLLFIIILTAIHCVPMIWNIYLISFAPSYIESLISLGLTAASWGIKSRLHLIKAKFSMIKKEK